MHKIKFSLLEELDKDISLPTFCNATQTGRGFWRDLLKKEMALSMISKGYRL